MRLLVIGINYWPEQTGIAPFTTGRCEYLAAQGHQVTVVTAMPYYPEWRVPESYRGRLLLRDQRNGVTILRSRIYVPRRVNSVRRLLHEASFVAASAARAIGAGKPDLMLLVSPPLGLALPALMLSRWWGVPYVFHVPDLQPDAALDLGMLPAGRFARILYALERTAYRNAAIVSTLTEAMRNRIVSKGIKRTRVKLFSDWAPPEVFQIPPSGGGLGFRRRHGLEGKLLLLHCGNMGVKQGLEVVLAAAALSRSDAQVVYLLVGDGAARTALEASASAAGLDNVRFMPLQAQDDFIEMLAAADVCLITQQRVVADIVFPSKTLTLMAAARPLIASVSDRSEVARVVNEAGAGIVTEAGDPRALWDAAQSLRDALPDRHAMGLRGRAYALARWERKRILAATAAELVAIIGGVQTPRDLEELDQLPGVAAKESAWQ